MTTVQYYFQYHAYDNSTVLVQCMTIIFGENEKIVKRNVWNFVGRDALTQRTSLATQNRWPCFCDHKIPTIDDCIGRLPSFDSYNITMRNNHQKTLSKPTFRIVINTFILLASFLLLGLLVLQKRFILETALLDNSVNHHAGPSSSVPPKEEFRKASKAIDNDDELDDHIQYLAIDSDSVVAQDIQSIWHDPSLQQICIQFLPKAKCPHAEFIGRLSGPSLVMLEWSEEDYFPKEDENNTTDSDNDNSGVQHCGSYSNATLLSTRNEMTKYFVEILILHCQNFGVGSILHQHYPMEWLHFNIQEACLENPDANRITQPNASIRISIPKKRTKISTPTGQWVQSSDTQSSPLMTRYQPQGCRSTDNNDKTTTGCQLATDAQRFAPYKFQWNRGQQERMTKTIQKLQWDGSVILEVCGDDLTTSHRKRECVLQIGEMLHNNTLATNGTGLVQSQPLQKVCVVGYSHSYHIIHAMHQLNLGHYFVWAQARYPTEIDFHFVRKHIREYNCQEFLIGVGQWPASQWGLQHKWPEGKPVPFGVYQHEIFRLLDMFRNHFSDTKVYMRSIHYNPIMEESGRCPPGDWRTPTVMNAYSEIIREQVDKVCKQSKHHHHHHHAPQIQFLDTRFITFPMWDSSYDWYHLADQVAQVEALYFASTILGNRASH